jgi:hypothetical protein
MTRPDRTELAIKLAHGAFALAAQTPWQHVTLSDLCDTSEATLMDCAMVSLTKVDITAQLDAMLDQAMLAASSKIDRTTSVRDRLFDVLMGRFDAMEDNRNAWASVLQAETRDFTANVARRARRARSGAWALEACGVNASDVRGAARAIGLARILRLTETVWIEDSPELAKTMARLDQLLRAGEEWVERLETARGFFSPKPANEPTL